MSNRGSDWSGPIAGSLIFVFIFACFPAIITTGWIIGWGAEDFTPSGGNMILAAFLLSFLSVVQIGLLAHPKLRIIGIIWLLICLPTFFKWIVGCFSDLTYV